MTTDRRALADQLMLVLLRADGKVLSGGYTDIMLGGAVLSDLILRGRIDIAGKGESVKSGRVVVRSPAPIGVELLDTALRKLVDKPGPRPSYVVRTLVKRQTVLERLATEKIVAASTHRVGGLFPVTYWPSPDSRPAEHARRGLQRVVDGGARPDPESAVLVLLLLAARTLHKVLPTDDRKAQRARVLHLAQENWASPTIRKAVQDVADGVSSAVAAVDIGE